MMSSMFFPKQRTRYDDGQAEVKHVELEDYADDADVDEEGCQQSPNLYAIYGVDHDICENHQKNIRNDAEQS